MDGSVVVSAPPDRTNQRPTDDTKDKAGSESGSARSRVDVKQVGQPAVRHYAPATAEEKHLDTRVNAKLDAVVLSILAVSFILCGIDKTNVGFVATSRFVEQAHLKPDDIPNSLSLYSATYVPLQPISVLLGRKLGPRWWIGCLLLSWGAICMGHAGISSSRELIALRLLLGAAESGFTQIAMYYMSTMYPQYILGLRLGIFSGMYSIAGAFAGLISYGLMQIESPVLMGWQIVFIFEGGLTVLVGLLALALLPTDVSNAWFLNQAEREHAVRRMERDLADAQEGIEHDEEGRPVVGISQNKITTRDIVDVLRDWKKLAIILFNILTVLVSIPRSGMRRKILHEAGS